MSRSGRLRVGFALASNASFEWHRLAVDRARTLDDVAITAFVLIATDRQPPDQHSDPAVRPVSVDEVCLDGPRVRLEDAPDLNDRIDVLIDLGGVDVVREPSLGVWRYAFGDGAAAAEGAPGTTVRLYRTTADPSRAVTIEQGWYRARTPDAWGTRSVSTRVAPWCARRLRQLAWGDTEALDGPVCPRPGYESMLPPDRPQTVAVDAADKLREWLHRQRWTVGIVSASIDEIMQRGRLPEPVWLRDQPVDRFYADPFPVAASGDTVQVLVEDYRYRSGRKGLTELEVGLDGVIRRATEQDTLPRPASYPFLLRRDGRLICVPETSAARAAQVFERQPDGAWVQRASLVEGLAFVDSTIVRRGGLWWLFCTNQGNEDQTELHLFFASSLDGPWAPHPLNPVKSDTRSARPAGACFEIDGLLYRPAQNCARRYGAAVTINRVVELTPRRFREEPVVTFGPAEGSPWPHGLHTINSLSGVTIVDGLRVEQRW